MRKAFNNKGIRYRLEAKQLYHDREEVTVFLTRVKK
jgi:23S rRNA C2498 (ribose-2'-O)-methylase RlmM